MAHQSRPREPRDPVTVACEVANAWLVQLRDRRTIDKMDPILVRKLEELHVATRGDNRRCFCLAGKGSGGAVHNLGCPASKT